MNWSPSVSPALHICDVKLVFLCGFLQLQYEDLKASYEQEKQKLQEMRPDEQETSLASKYHYVKQNDNYSEPMCHEF